MRNLKIIRNSKISLVLLNKITQVHHQPWFPMILPNKMKKKRKKSKKERKKKKKRRGKKKKKRRRKKKKENQNQRNEIHH